MAVAVDRGVGLVTLLLRGTALVEDEGVDAAPIHGDLRQKFREKALSDFSHGKIRALVRGRDYVIPQDVVEVIPDVLRHRLVLTYDALADEISSETVVNRILQTVALPQVNAIPQQGHAVGPAVPAAAAAANGR